MKGAERVKDAGWGLVPVCARTAQDPKKQACVEHPSFRCKTMTLYPVCATVAFACHAKYLCPRPFTTQPEMHSFARAASR